MLVSSVIKTSKIIVLQQLIINTYRGIFSKLPTRPDLFLDGDDVKAQTNPVDKLLYLHFSNNKDVMVPLNSFLDRQLTTVDKLALAVYTRYFKPNEILLELLDAYPEIEDTSLWFS
jgi:hypothetical protein